MSTVVTDETVNAAGKLESVDSGANFATVIHDDAATALRRLPSDVFNVALTSPPYYWARDYGFDGRIGHEDSVKGYVTALMDVFDEVRRVLHPEGVFFLNQCCPGKVAPSDGKSRPLNVLWPVLPGNDLKSRGRKWSPERSIRTRHNEG